MATSLIFESAPANAAHVGLSPLAELGAHLHALAHREHHPQAIGQPIHARHPDLADEFYRWAPLWATYRGRFLFPYRSLLGRKLADELADIADLPLPRFAEYAAYAIRGGHSGVRLDRILDDPEQQQHLRHTVQQRSTARSELADQLLIAPAAFRDRLLDFLARYAAAQFDAEWQALQPRLQAEVHRLRIRIRDRGVAAALAELSPSATYLKCPERVIVDTMQYPGIVRLREPYQVVPSHYGWPHFVIKREPGWPILIQYGLLPGDRPREVSLSLVRSRLQVLLDPARIRLCRMIVNDGLTTVELARRSGMMASQVSRHLRKLREAELVRAERNGRLVYYHLDLNAVRMLGSDLEMAMRR
jgi:DNA-binding transcriptional ArsR family regulator